MTKQLFMGGARSGKSRLAEQAAVALHMKRIYVATATAGDLEMQRRIANHKQQRDDQWLLVEEPLALGKIIEQYAKPSAVILIDCLTLWLSNCLHEVCWPEQRALFLENLAATQGNVVMVSNEVGSGIVPMGELSREFVDEAGRLHQDIGAICNRVSLVVAGLALELKDE